MMVRGAGRAPARSRIARSFACWTVKFPEICPEPPRIGSRITGAEITLLSRVMANGFSTLGLVSFANFCGAAGSEAEIDDRLVSTLIEARLRVDQIAARDQYAFLDEIFLAWRFAGEDFGIGRMRLFGLLRRHRHIDHAKIELCGLAQNFLES